ncbi:ATP-binding protein [Actinomadura sp. KC06]|uniref:sensor histidine kinase n=1 Tax=Actinomadura sp. KC06 TaxID=2530369 RepID=UPI00104F4FAC|nr:ATP-binding protein [Actinomadura sp. KC06]TDD34057.1 ATP-binding protein [Actinomadura sp. KC06]
MLPATIVGLLGVAAVIVLYSGHTVSEQTRLVLAAAAVGAAITIGAAVVAADATTRRVHRQHAQSAVRDRDNILWRLGELGSLVAHGRRDLQKLSAALIAGEKAAPRGEDYPAPDTADPVILLAYELRKAQSEAWNAVVAAAAREPAGSAGQRVGVFVNLARRMQSLSHRAIQGLDELENQVEDPDLLKGLFKVDHLTTRTRRQAESLAVIGGAASRRRWTKPVSVYEVLRSSIAEVEHYNRVKVVPPIEGSLHGSAVADIVHLLAELIENATKFSPPNTQVLIRVEMVSAGLAIEVEDRGIGIPRGDQRRLNELLADQERADTEELLKDGRIGLLVVSALARRHKVRVQLQGNVYGGTQAVVVVPKELEGSQAEAEEAAEEKRRAEAAQARAARPPAATTTARVAEPAAGSVQSAGSLPSAGTGPQLALNDRDVLGVGPVAVEGQVRRPHRPAHARPSTPTADASDVPNPPDVSTGPLPVVDQGLDTSAPASGPAASGPAASVPDAAEPAAPGNGGARPPLPQRQAQTHLPPELADAPVFQQDDPDEEVEHNPGLMAAFQKGIRSVQEDDGAADGQDSAS